MVALTSDGAGSLFTIPAADWTAISTRVGLVWLARDIVSSIEHYLPGFAALESACQKWKDATFPGLVAASDQIGAYCSDAIAHFEPVQPMIAKLDPNAPLPDDVARAVQAVIERLADEVAAIDQDTTSLGADVLAFTAVNNAVDAQIERFINVLGPDWTVLTAESSAVDAATGRMLGAWSAIADDLRGIASGRVALTTPLLVGLNIASALLSWTHLCTEATEFASLAAGQAGYLAGSAAT